MSFESRELSSYSTTSLCTDFLLAVGLALSAPGHCLKKLYKPSKKRKVTFLDVETNVQNVTVITCRPKDHSQSDLLSFMQLLRPYIFQLRILI